MSTYRRYWYVGWESKRCYQRNMLLSLCIVVVLAAGVAALVGLAGHNPRIAARKVLALQFAANCPGDTNGSDSGLICVEIPYTGRATREREWPTGGFISRLRVISDQPVIPVSASSLDWDTPFPTVLSCQSFIAGGEIAADLVEPQPQSDFGLPAPVRLCPIGVLSAFPNVRTQELMTASGFSFAGLFEPTGYLNWPRLAKSSDTGYVVWSFVIDPSGRIESDSWQLLTESPKDKGFAGAVKHYIIYKTNIVPRTRNGRHESIRIAVATTCCQVCTPAIEVVDGTMHARLQAP